MKGNYWDTFAKFNLDYDKRNQKYKTSKGFRSFYNLDMPIYSDTNTLTNNFNSILPDYEHQILSTISVDNSLDNLMHCLNDLKMNDFQQIDQNFNIK